MERKAFALNFALAHGLRVIVYPDKRVELVPTGRDDEAKAALEPYRQAGAGEAAD